MAALQIHAMFICGKDKSTRNNTTMISMLGHLFLLSFMSLERPLLSQCGTEDLSSKFVSRISPRKQAIDVMYGHMLN
jgi:hypothetical protein